MMWRSRHSGTHDEALLTALAARLRGMARSVEPRADFRSSLRTSLVMEASTALVPDEQALQPARFTRVVPRRRLAIVTAFVAASLGLGSMASASASALPGEALYPVKRATERVELTFHRGLADRGAFQLELAERRLDEARELSARGPEYADLAAESVREFEEAAAAGTADLVAAFREDHSRSSMVVLNRFTERTEDVLAGLSSQLPAEATVALDQARDQLDTIANRSEDLCPSCGDGSDDGATPPADSGGPATPGPEPEPEPEAPPSDPSPVDPAAPASPTTAPSDGGSTASEDEDESDEDEDEDEDSDSDDDSDEPEAPTPTPTPEPTPEPTPTPTPTPTPSPDPTEPPPGGLLEGVGDTVGELVGGTLGALNLSPDAD